MACYRLEVRTHGSAVEKSGVVESCLASRNVPHPDGSLQALDFWLRGWFHDRWHTMHFLDWNRSIADARLQKSSPLLEGVGLPSLASASLLTPETFDGYDLFQGSGSSTSGSDFPSLPLHGLGIRRHSIHGAASVWLSLSPLALILGLLPLMALGTWRCLLARRMEVLQ